MAVKRTITFDDDVDAAMRKLDREQMPTMSALINDAVRDYLDNPEAFGKRRSARLRREAQAEPVSA